MIDGNTPTMLRSSIVVRILLVIGGMCAALGLMAGHLNRELLDGPTFAAHVDEIRRDDAVSTNIGRTIATQLLRANPDLVALGPLVEAVSIRVAGGNVLSVPTRLAARSAHQALTEQDADSVALRIADAGAVVSAVVHAVAPERALLSPDVSVTLVSIGSQDFASTTLAIARAVGVLAWLLPVLAVACFATVVVAARSRWDAMASVGRTLAWAAAGVGAVLVIGRFVVRRFDADVLSGAVTRAAWDVMMRPLWWGVVVVAAVGIAIVVACTSSAPAAMARQAARARSIVMSRPERPLGIVIRALLAVAVGVAAITDPIGLIEPIIVLAGVGLALFAITEIAKVAEAARATAPSTPGAAPQDSTGTAPRPIALGAAVLAGLVLVAGVVLLARPGRDVSAAAESGPGAGTVCNGHAELCDRRFNEVAYAATHNSMAVAGAPGWFLGEQSDPIPTQLDQGVRALLIDVWSGVPAGNIVRTARSSYAEALAIAEEELGPEVVDAALRLANSIAGEAEGAEARFMCHGLCETGSTPLLETLRELRGWLALNPDEVVTLFIEDHVDAALIAADVEATGLLPFVHTPVRGEPWPTLGEMIRSGRRLVVMLEAGSGGDAAPWLVNGFEHTQETPFTFPTVESFNCDPNRGPEDAPLFQMNHWLARFTSLVTDAQLVNARDVLLVRAEQCREERGQIPNFIAVNYVAIGDVFDVVDELNGVA